MQVPQQIEMVLAVLKKISIILVWILKTVVSFAYELRFGRSLYFRKQGNMYYKVLMFALLITA